MQDLRGNNYLLRASTILRHMPYTLDRQRLRAIHGLLFHRGEHGNISRSGVWSRDSTSHEKLKWQEALGGEVWRWTHRCTTLFGWCMKHWLLIDVLNTHIPPYALRSDAESSDSRIAKCKLCVRCEKEHVLRYINIEIDKQKKCAFIPFKNPQIHSHSLQSTNTRSSRLHPNHEGRQKRTQTASDKKNERVLDLITS